MLLTDILSRDKSRWITEKYGITTVEEAQQLTDEQLLNVRYIGKIAIQKIRKATDYTLEQIPSREVCKMCWNEITVGFKVPNHIWKASVPSLFKDKTLCLGCFTKQADHKLIAWSEKIEFFPVSLRDHLTRNSNNIEAYNILDDTIVTTIK